MENKRINAIIVDDEKGCISNLRDHLLKMCPDIYIIATGTSLQEALDQAAGQKVDLAFLDIELFNDNIFNSLPTSETINFKIVFVTAYAQYALKAIKVEALDYLLKPLADDEILECYAKIKRFFFSGDNEVISAIQDEKKHNKIIIKNSDQIYVVKPGDVYYISGCGFYSEVTFEINGEIKTVIVSKPLNVIEIEYAHASFFRIHKSFIVNVNKIANVLKQDGLALKMNDEKIIPVARRRVNSFLSFIK